MADKKSKRIYIKTRKHITGNNETTLRTIKIGTTMRDSAGTIKSKRPAVILGTYKEDGITSVGGRIGKVGGTVGYDKKKKKPFGSVNVKGKVIGKFGPQGN